MKKRVLATTLALSLCLATAPAMALEENQLSVTWYPEAHSIFRFYGTDRMLLEKDGYALYGLDGTKYTDYNFEVVDPFRFDGQTVACLKGTGKWGRIDRNGATVKEFVYDSREAANKACNAQFVSNRDELLKELMKSGRAHSTSVGQEAYAVADLEGNLLTDYKYWYKRDFSCGYALVNVDDGWCFVNDKGVEITQPQKEHGDLIDGGSDGWFCISYSVDRFGKVYDCYNIYDIQDNAAFDTPLSTAPWRAGKGLWGFVIQSGQVGFYDTATRKVVIEPGDYYYVQNALDNVHYVFDDNGNAKGYYVFDDNGNAKGYVMEGNNPREVTLNLTELIENTSHEGLRRVQDSSSGKWGFQDESGNLIVPYIYDGVGYFDHGVASVLRNGVYGLLKNPLTAGSEQQQPAKPAATQASNFTDVPSDAWFAPYVNYVTKDGVMLGMGSGQFAPNNQLTKAECLTLAVRLYDLMHGGTGVIKEAPADWTFTDATNAVNPLTGAWYRNSYYTAEVLGLNDKPAFKNLEVIAKATESASRNDFAKALYAASGALEKIREVKTIPDVPSQGNDDIYALYEAGILTGMDSQGTFSGDKALSRAEVAGMVARVLEPSLRVSAKS